MQYFDRYAEEAEPSADPSPDAPVAEGPLAALPDVSIAPHVVVRDRTPFEAPEARVIRYNLKAEALFAPLQGPVQPHQLEGLAGKHRNHITGDVEAVSLAPAAFDSEYHAFLKTGSANDPSDFARMSFDPQSRHSQRRTAVTESLADGPWSARSVGVERRAKKMREVLGDDAEAMAEDTAIAAAEAFAAMEAAEAAVVERPPEERITSTFHGKAEKDFQGKPWCARPGNCKPREPDAANFLPKKCIHTYSGHTMGVHSVRFIPESGHLLLSASMDSKLRVWDTHNQRKCLRVYMGHDHAVRDVQWTLDGDRIYSCSFDKNVLLWDTEYGKIIGTFNHERMPYCVTVCPERGQEHIFLVGNQNKKCLQWDARSGQITQEYCEHLGAVNTVTFVDDNRKIVTTADDKKMFVWEFGVPVVVKHIAEAHMHSMPAVRVHPEGKFFCCQSLDNKIVTYEATGRFRFQARKKFSGHANACHAIRPNFSPDGQHVMSGDVTGKLWFWDWKTMKNYRTLRCHEGVCIDADWHPTHASRVATCGWDGLVKLWE